MEFARATSNQSGVDPQESIESIRDEIEILAATLAPYEITHEVEEVTVDEGGDCDGASAYEKHTLKLTIAPAVLEGQKIAIFVEHESRYVPVQYLPRLSLSFTFHFSPDKVGEYPGRAMPPY